MGGLYKKILQFVKDISADTKKIEKECKINCHLKIFPSLFLAV